MAGFLVRARIGAKVWSSGYRVGVIPIEVAIPLFGVLALASACGVYFGTVLCRGLGSMRTLPTVRDGIALAEAMDRNEGCLEWPRVCVIIPAHNEEDVIEHVARSLTAQTYPELRVVFVLDRCTDGTERVLREVMAEAGVDGQFEILVNDTCPEGWAGKVHAAWRGARESAGAREAALLLFADADTQFDPRCVGACVALQKERRLDLLSVLSTLTCDRWYERLVQPAAGFELVRQYPLDLVNREGSKRSFANGQFMLFTKSAYDTIGGHERVKDELLEDIAFARIMHRTRYQMRCGCLLADGMLGCCMYRSWSAFQRGWKRIFTEAASRRVSRLKRSAWRLVMTGVVLPGASVVCAGAGGVVLGMGDGALGWSMLGVGGSAVALYVGALMMVYRSQRVPMRWVGLYPYGAWRVASILREAARDLETGEHTHWGGRSYAREARA